VLKESRDLAAGARADTPDAADGALAPPTAQDPHDDGAMSAALVAFSADTRIPGVALITVAALLTRIYGPARSGRSDDTSLEPA
jgi:hypothetical protein